MESSTVAESVRRPNNLKDIESSTLAESSTVLLGGKRYVMESNGSVPEAALSQVCATLVFPALPFNYMTSEFPSCQFGLFTIS